MTEQEWMNTTTRLVADYVWCAVEHTKALNSPRLAGLETLREKRVAAHAVLMAHLRAKLPFETGDLTLAYMAGAGGAIKPIRNDEGHKTALEEISALAAADPKPGTPEGDRLDVLATLAEAYETKRFPFLREAWVAQAMLLAHAYRHAGTAPGPVGEAERKLKAFLTNQGE